jgi:hypothetical protein
MYTELRRDELINGLRENYVGVWKEKEVTVTWRSS